MPNESESNHDFARMAGRHVNVDEYCRTRQERSDSAYRLLDSQCAYIIVVGKYFWDLNMVVIHGIQSGECSSDPPAAPMILDHVSSVHESVDVSQRYHHGKDLLEESS